MDTKFNEKDVMTMKLLHYFITEKNYNPVVLQGVKNEIWLENMDQDYQIVRIVSEYIHNNEQYNVDTFKTKRILKAIKRQTLNLKMDVLSIFLDLGDNVELHQEKHLSSAKVENEKDIKNYDFINETFPDITKKLTFTEKGVNLFLKITGDINEKNVTRAKKVEKVFQPKTPIITYVLITINILIFLVGLIFNKHEMLINAFATYGPLIRTGEYYRLITGAFLHANIVHILVNMYSLSILGKQAESFFGKIKFLIIYLISAITGSLLSILLNGSTPSIGASGAIFGIFGALLYFGYHYRVYLGNTLVKEMVPIIVLNLLLGFALPGIDNFAHIGGLVGGFLIAKALGFNEENNKSDKINGIILSLILIGFLIYMNFFYV